MKVIFDSEPKEIADLVLALQGRRNQKVELQLDGEAIAKAALEATHDKSEA